MTLNPKLSEDIYKDFPQLYRGRYKSKYESAMCWGFDCGDGWFQLLYDLSLELSNYLAANPALDFEVVQVKSKLGILHFRLNYRDATTERMIALARQRASVTCELTGKPGQLCVNAKSNIPEMVLCPEKAAELGFAVVDNNIVS